MIVDEIVLQWIGRRYDRIEFFICKLNEQEPVGMLFELILQVFHLLKNRLKWIDGCGSDDHFSKVSVVLGYYFWWIGDIWILLECVMDDST